jgi:predicted nucleic acid-binding protein
MRVVDTSAWIEWMADSPAGRAVSEALPERGDWLVPTLVQLELSKWLSRERGESDADKVIAFSQTCQVVDLDTRTALLAADLCAQFKLATADAVIYATARVAEAELLTCDAHFQGLEGVIFIPKNPDR